MPKHPESDPQNATVAGQGTGGGDSLTVPEVRAKWNRRYLEKVAAHSMEQTGPVGPQPNQLALRHAGLMQGGRMLDAACGLGAGIAVALGRYHTLYGVDLSDQAIRAARAYWGPRPGLHWVVGDVAAMAWPPGHLQLICAFGFTDWNFLRQTPTMLSSGGLMLYQGFSPRELANRPRLSLEWTSTPEKIQALYPGWRIVECGESAEPPFRVSLAAVKP